MKIGIIVYSQSGHTAFFAKEIAAQLRDAGLVCDMELLFPYGIPKPWTSKIQFRKIPEVTEYDIILLGSPVWAFNVSSVMLSFLNQTDILKNKKALPFVTHSLPSKALGAHRALRTMSNTLEFCGADVLEGESQWYFPFITKKASMKDAAQRIVTKVKEISVSETT